MEEKKHGATAEGRSKGALGQRKIEEIKEIIWRA